MTTQLAKHAVMQIALIAYSVLISGAGMRLARITERQPNGFIRGLHDYGFLLLLIPVAWFFFSLRDSQQMEAHEISGRALVSSVATAASYVLVAFAFVASFTILVSHFTVWENPEQKKAATPRPAHGVSIE